VTAGAARLLVALLVAALAAAGPTLRAQPGGDQTRAVDAAQPTDDLWDFPDDGDEAEGWPQRLRNQGTDLAAFAVFAALAMVGFFRKSVRLKYATLVASVVYLGAVKSQLVSVVNLFGLVSGNLPVFAHNLAWYFFALFSVATTVLWGRVYCGRICAFGALTQLLDRAVPARWRVEVPPWLERRAAKVKYVLLGATLLYYVVTRDIGIYRYVEPFWMFTGQGTVLMWTLLALLLAATLFVRNVYCRFLCPVGAALGILSTLTVFRIKRWSECRTCKICEKACEWGAIQGPRIVMTECVRCDDCERLYMDTKKCPHWIVIRKKSEIMARQSAAPAR
jgi:polyferredoxin